MPSGSSSKKSHSKHHVSERKHKSSKSSSSKRDGKSGTTAGENGSVTYGTEIDLAYSTQNGGWTDQNTEEYASHSYSAMDFAYIGSQFNYK